MSAHFDCSILFTLFHSIHFYSMLPCAYVICWIKEFIYLSIYPHSPQPDAPRMVLRGIQLSTILNLTLSWQYPNKLLRINIKPYKLKPIIDKIIKIEFEKHWATGTGFFFFCILAQSYTSTIYTPTPIPLLYIPFTIVLHKSLRAYPFRAAQTPACWIGKKRNKELHPATPGAAANREPGLLAQSLAYVNLE